MVKQVLALPSTMSLFTIDVIRFSKDESTPAAASSHAIVG